MEGGVGDVSSSNVSNSAYVIQFLHTCNERLSLSFSSLRMRFPVAADLPLDAVAEDRFGEDPKSLLLLPPVTHRDTRASVDSGT